MALWHRSGDRTYDTPEQAVLTTCHAVGILGVHIPFHGTDVMVGWQPRGAAIGDGWDAKVVGRPHHYRVADCTQVVVTHG